MEPLPIHRRSSAFIKENAKNLGLQLNEEKCEIFFCNGQENSEAVNAFKSLAPGIRVVNEEELELLGSPLLESGIEHFAKRKFEKLHVLINRLNLLQTHYGYFILKNCLAIPKVVYLFRCTPLWKFSDLLHQLDMEMKSALEKITNTQLDAHQWVQSSLPVNFGGLGIRSLVDISLPAFLASVSGTKGLISTLIKIQDYESEVPYFYDA